MVTPLLSRAQTWVVNWDGEFRFETSTDPAHHAQARGGRVGAGEAILLMPRLHYTENLVKVQSGFYKLSPIFSRSLT